MENLEPILISAAVRRSGTTLIQRLLCSADNCLIYGESCAQELNFFIQMYLSKAINFGSSSVFRDEMLAEVLKGNTDDWIADIMPPVLEYIEQYKKSSGLFLNYLSEYAAKESRPIWGMKMAEWPSVQLMNVYRNFPKTKLIYIHRDLEACVKSAKTLQVIHSIGEVEQFCQIWQQNYDIILKEFPKEQLLLIDYQELLADPAKAIADLENFTGAKGIKASVMQRKINTYKFDDRQAEGTKEGYLKPGDLSKEELAIIQKYQTPQTN